MKKLVPELVVLCAIVMVTSCGFAQTWVQSAAPFTNWVAVAASADGSKLVAIANGQAYGGAGPIFTSTNSGVSWNQSGAPSAYWSAVASSADGSKLVAVQTTSEGASGSIFISTNSGATWNKPNILPNASGWSSVASSADGTKLATVSSTGSGIYISTNSGYSWIQATNVNAQAEIFSSADGSKLATLGLLFSTNSGMSWYSGVYTGAEHRAVAMSSDGKLLFLKADNGVYQSTNNGLTWSKVFNGIVLGYPYSISMSSDGSKTIITYGSTNVLSSYDSGATWTTNSMAFTNDFVTCSADGNTLIALGNLYDFDDANVGGNIYVSHSLTSPQLNLAQSDTNLALSWTIPSTNFVLQQSADLVSWADMTDAPALNLTNLQNQVTLTPSNTAAFYRLKTP